MVNSLKYTKNLFFKISSITNIYTLILFFLILGQPNIHAATCSDTAGTIVISSDCEDFADSGTIDSLTINSGVTVDRSGTTRAIDLNEISMGMSSDYLNAIKFKSTYLRIGSNIFGQRG